MHGHQLDRGDAETDEMLDRRGMGEARVRAAQDLGDVRVAFRESLDVQLVDDRVRPWRVRAAVIAPRKGLIDNDAAGHGRRRVDTADAQVVAAEPVSKERASMTEAARDGASVGVEQQLRRVVPEPFVRRVATVDAVAVALAGTDVRDVPVPDKVGTFDERMCRQLGPTLVEQHQVDGLGALREDREIGAGAVPCRAEGRVGTRPCGTAVGRASGGGRLLNGHGSTQVADLEFPT
jgi:hypothetical protein